MLASTEIGVPMPPERRALNDPRTVARDIPGIFDALFPQLVPGVVAHFNRRGRAVVGCDPVPNEIVATSSLQHAMLFEIAVAAGEQQLAGHTIVDWDICLQVAVQRQRHHFDAELPTSLSAQDVEVASWVARNLVTMLTDVCVARGNQPLSQEPHIPGYHWIASGHGDFSTAGHIIEVKCATRRFSTSDYRQVVMYWLLSYAAALETEASEWSAAVLLNPRLNLVVEFSFDEIIDCIAGGRSKVDLLELFAAMVSQDAHESH